MVRCAGPQPVCDGEIPRRAINLGSRSMVAVVLADATAASPARRRHADAVEERPDIVGTEICEQLQAAPGWADLGIGLRRVEDCCGPGCQRAVLGNAAIEVDTDEEQVAADVAQLDSDAAALAVDDAPREVRSLGASAPGRRIVSLRLAAVR